MTRATPDRETFAAHLEGGGELGALTRGHDWSATALGDPSTWPSSLSWTLGLCLDSAFPIAIYWGPSLVLLYNDAWRPILGEKHPWALGRPAREVWPEIWDDIAPVFSRVMRERVGVFHRDSLLAMHRHGYVEECYFDYTFNPIRDTDGQVAGILNVVTETTYRVIAERRGGVQRDFAARLAGSATTEQVLENAASALRGAGHDVPFAAFYRPDRGSSLLAAVGSEAGRHVPWPVQEAATSGRAVTLHDVVQRHGVIPAGVWPEPVRQAMVLPVTLPGAEAPSCVLVVGASPRRELDADYEAFFHSLAGHVATSLANAEAFEAQRRRAEALAELDRAKSAFFSNVSHEFRTPLTLMLGPVQDLLEEEAGPLPPAARELLEVVHRNGQRLLKLVNSLLDFSRIEAGRLHAIVQPVDLAAFTAELASTFRSAVEKAGMRLLVQCAPMQSPAYVDRDMWERIVLNLVSNAFKYTLEGEIRVRLHADGGRAILEVEDTGIGIAQDELPRIFQRFHRVEGARGRTQEGSGIGLALVQELVRLHGGSIEAHSVPGQGSRFTVSMPLGKSHLPADQVREDRDGDSTAPVTLAYAREALRWLRPTASDDAAGSASPVPAPAPAAPRARIVVADDNADVRDYVARLLSMHDVVAVCDGVEALAEARARPPDLVLTDVMMPRLDGFGLLRALRDDAATSTVPVIMLSARAGEEAGVEGRSAGADDYLVKPFGARELQARVQAQLALRRVRDDALERERALRTEAETLNAVAQELAAELDLDTLVQKVTDAATSLTGAKFGAFFYNVVDARGEAYQLFCLSGAPREAFERLGMPRNTPMFETTFAGGPPVRLHDVKRDPRYGRMAPHHGHPEGHLPVSSYLAVPVKTRAGQVLGGLFFGHPEPGMFTAHAERLSVGIAALAAVAMDNARLYQASRDADRRKDEFLATLAHELRNPLAPLRNGVEILLHAVREPRIETVCRMMERQLGHIVRLIDDLLDISRVSLGKVTLAKAPVQLTRVLHSAAETSRPLVEARGHRLTMALPDEEVWIHADATRMVQVFANLLNNAAKFTPPKGRVDVRVDPRGTTVEVSVHDNGIGIPTPMLERIFELFSQLEDPMQKTQSGLGIGLTLVRQLVEMHGGTVRAESAGPGQGATLRVVLPALTPEPSGQATAGGKAGARSPLRVLIADDNVDAADSLAAVLMLHGHEVTTVHTGEDAVREAASRKPHAVFLDIGMPGMNGYEACRAIRAAQPRDSAMLIAALTGWGEHDRQERSLQVGFDRHLIKPAAPEDVLGVIEEAVRRMQGP